MSHYNDARGEALDQATSRRLGRLRTMPVETGRLDQMLRAAVPAVVGVDEAASSSRWSIGYFLRPMRAVAASLILIAGIAALLLVNSSGAALASTEQMARMHEDLVSGRVPVTEVKSLEEAGQMLGGKGAAVPSLPSMPTGATQPQAHVMACCIKSVQNKRVACVLLKSEGVPVTMAVADAKDVRSPKSPVVVHSGTRYHVQSSGSLNMVMTEREGRWVCLIAELPAERLMGLAAHLEF
jgi:hypothetical protein